MRLAGILAAGILLALVSFQPASRAGQTVVPENCVTTGAVVQSKIDYRLAQVRRSKTCYACGLCGSGDTSCCGGSQYWTESCTKPDGNSGYKCCKWD